MEKKLVCNTETFSNFFLGGQVYSLSNNPLKMHFDEFKSLKHQL